MMTPLAALALVSLMTSAPQVNDSGLLLQAWSARVERLNTSDRVDRIRALSEWAPAIHSEATRLAQVLTSSASHQPHNAELLMKALDTAGRAIARSLASGDEQEVRESMRVAAAAKDEFYGDAWQWPTCGNRWVGDLGGYVDLRGTVKAHPNWALTLLVDRNPAIVIQVAASMPEERWNEVEQILTPNIASQDPRHRAIGLAILATHQDELNLPLLETYLEDSSKDLRQEAVRILGYDKEKGIDFLNSRISSFHHRSVEFRCAMLDLAGDLSWRELISEAKRLRSDTDPDLRSHGLDYLLFLKQPVSSEEIRWGIRHGCDYAKPYWIEEAQSRPELIEDLFALLLNESFDDDAWYSLCETSDLRVILRLLDRYEHDLAEDGKSVWSMGALADALARVGQPAESKIRSLARSAKPHSRSLAVTAALARKGQALLDVVDSLSRDRDVQVRLSAADSLPRLPHNLAWPRALFLLQDKMEEVRLKAVEAMGFVALESDIPTPEVLTKSTDTAFAEAAKSALETAKSRAEDARQKER